jgi:hypothetical protein
MGLLCRVCQCQFTTANRNSQVGVEGGSGEGIEKGFRDGADEVGIDINDSASTETG